MTRSEKVKTVARILRKKFDLIGGVTNEEIVVIAWNIIEALEKTPSKVEVKPSE